MRLISDLAEHTKRTIDIRVAKNGPEMDSMIALTWPGEGFLKLWRNFCIEINREINEAYLKRLKETPVETMWQA